jgi:hypothetical protein
MLVICSKHRTASKTIQGHTLLPYGALHSAASLLPQGRPGTGDGGPHGCIDALLGLQSAVVLYFDCLGRVQTISSSLFRDRLVGELHKLMPLSDGALVMADLHSPRLFAADKPLGRLYGQNR